MATATVAPLGATVSGSSLTSSSYDYDYYAIDLAQAGRLSLNFKFPTGLGTGNSYDLSIYNENGIELYDFDLNGAAADGTWLAGQGTFLPAGRFYIEIYGNNSRASWGKTYTLNTTLAAGRVELEPNSETATATVVPLGATVSGSALKNSSYDYDYYAIDLAQAGRLSLNFKFPTGLGTGNSYDLSIYNENGIELYDFDLNGAAADGTWLAGQGTFLPAGRFYIEIYGNNSRASWGKTYTLNTTLAAGRVELEPNSETATATVVPLGATVSGSALKNSSYDYDYYAIDLAKAGRVRLNFAFPAGLGAGSSYDVSVYNENGTRLYDFDLTGAEANGSWLASQILDLPAGRAYIQVYGNNSRASWGKTYTLNAGWIWSATPVPGISGTPQVGRTLTAFTGTWSPTPDVLRYQWFRSGVAITGATRTTYTLVAADYSKTITLKVTGSKAGYPTTTKISRATAAVTAGALTAGTPVITGTNKVGYLLAASPGIWGPSPVALSYSWYRSGIAISGAGSASYRLAAADLGKTITVKVIGRKTGYVATAKTSAATAAVAPGTLATATPTITGTTVVGSTLTANTGAWGPSPVAFSYKWYRSGVLISGASSATYKLITADRGQSIKVTVTGSKPGYTTAARASTGTAVIR